ncbi:MAG: bacteriohemerythrin [Betaproteobacteria bacterium]|nr:bacteriohemerythrin [Betaproteobacteria bacterium]
MIPAEGGMVPHLGVPEMDQTHEEFVKHIAWVETAPDSEVLARLTELMTHTEAHFSQETRRMESMSFPLLGCHGVEHEGVLEVMREARRYVEEGKFEVGRVLARELGVWFQNHAATMDAMLAQAMRAQGVDGCGGGECVTTQHNAHG